MRSSSDANIPFNQLRHLLRRFGFNERIRGDHHIFTKHGVEEILNLQPKGHHAKPYQVKQVRGVLVKYHLAGGTNEI
ncbi:MAG: type II toxin-antitoxin system HicA family toxin [Candidatus Binatia bacterium]